MAAVIPNSKVILTDDEIRAAMLLEGKSEQDIEAAISDRRAQADAIHAQYIKHPPVRTRPKPYDVV